MIAHQHAGIGLGLRTQHYHDFLAGPQPVDWLEVITDNYLVDGGKPLVMLDAIRRDYPMAMHGVAMSLGSAEGVSIDYLRRVKALADRVQPMWVSDHLCWGGWRGQCLHDLYPMPYTEAAAAHLIAQIRRVQDVLQRRLVIENVSSYVTYRQSVTTEWDFLRHVVQEADALLLVDVNNVYVSSVNHGFDPEDYLRAMPAQRVQQMHLAGHSYQGDLIIDTHDHPVSDAVWALFAQACRLWGHVPSMIERDDDIPPLEVLVAELAHARQIVATYAPMASGAAATPVDEVIWASAEDDAWRATQDALATHVLTPRVAPDATPWVVATSASDAQQRAGVYRHAYRARLAEALGESFERVRYYMGSDDFDPLARAFAVTHPPTVRSLGDYGADFPAYLAATFPEAPVVAELAQLDWDLRKRFDAVDAPALDAQQSQAMAWALSAPGVLHPTLVLRRITTNVVKLWQALDDDTEVPLAHSLDTSATLAVWRQGLTPMFRTLGEGEAVVIQAMAAGEPLADVADRLGGSAALPQPGVLAGWLSRWLTDGLLRAPSDADQPAALGA
jgi:uncharacterized protein (UPF0276 family)